MKNRLVIIGWTGIKKAYLNLSDEEAIARYLAEEESCGPDEARSRMQVIEFDDEFSVYDAWA